MNNDENNVITKDQIMFSFILTRLLFADDYIESLNNMAENEKKFVFESIISNVMADTFFTKFDKGVDDRLYNILNYYRNIYKNEESFEKINDAIEIINNQDESICVYPTQFESRYETIFNKRYRKKLIAEQLKTIKVLVEQSIINDLPFFYDIDHLKGPEFNSTYGNSLLSISNATYLLNTFPEIFNDSMTLIKVHNLLSYNVECTKSDVKANPLVYAGSCMTLKKIYKMIKKNK